MSRGSISSWQDYGRRSSQSMPQFSGDTMEYMTSDSIVCKRGDGWFLSYTKIAGIVVVFIIGVVAAGFLGWYINSLPKKKPYDSLDLVNDGIEDVEEAGEAYMSPSVNPLKYRLELTPIIDIDNVPWLKCRMVVEFQVNETTSLTKLSLNARNITVTTCKLSLLDSGKDDGPSRRKSRRHTNDAGDHVNRGHNGTLGNNGTMPADKNVDTTTWGPFDTLSINNGSFSSNSSNNNTLSVENVLTEIEITEYCTDDEKDVHTIHLANRLQEGIYFLEINYEISIDENAFLIANRSSSVEERWLIGTRLKRSDARFLFPVFDMMHKSVFSLSIVHPREWRVLSNMPLKTLRDTSNASMVTDTFDETPPLYAHNLAFLMGNIESVGVTFIANSKVAATFWADSNQQSQAIYLFDKVSPVVISLIDLFSMPFPLPKMDLVGLPSGVDVNLASPGLIAMKHSLFYTTESSPTLTKTDALRTLVALLGQQWLDEFMCVNRTDSWMFEGSMIYFQREVVLKIDPSSIDYFVDDIQLHIMEMDGYTVSRPLHESVSHRSLHSIDDEHAKGACLIRMLHGAINDTTFRNGYKKLISRWKYNTTDFADFMNILGEEEAALPSGVSLEEAMNSWILQGGYPVVTVIRNYEKGSAIVYQEQFTWDRPLESISKFWHVPLNYVEENGNWSSPVKIWFPSEPKISLDNIGTNQSWILFNVNKTGYYRVHYDEKNWKLLKMAIHDNHYLFPAETRASLVDDVFSLAAVGLMKYEAAFDFVEYMQMKERHYLPWIVLMRHIFKLNRLLYETPIFSAFQEFMMRFVSPLYNEVGSTLKQGSQLTMVAVKMACMFEHAGCLNWTNNVFEVAMNETEFEELVPSYIRETFYCNIARYGTRKEWGYFAERMKSLQNEEERKHLLSALACFQAPWILQSILNEILHEERFRLEEISIILKSFPRNPAAAQAASRFVRANWQEIAQRFAGSYSVLQLFVSSMANSITTEQDLEDLQTFRENNYESMKGTRSAAALVEAMGRHGTLFSKMLPDLDKILVKNDEDVSGASAS